MCCSTCRCMFWHNRVFSPSPRPISSTFHHLRHNVNIWAATSVRSADTHVLFERLDIMRDWTTGGIGWDVAEEREEGEGKCAGQSDDGGCGCLEVIRSLIAGRAQEQNRGDPMSFFFWVPLVFPRGSLIPCTRMKRSVLMHLSFCLPGPAVPLVSEDRSRLPLARQHVVPRSQTCTIKSSHLHIQSRQIGAHDLSSGVKSHSE